MSEKKKKIVVIDDSVIILQMLEDTLSEAGYEVATMPEPSREELVAEAGDLLLVDVNLPHFFGDDAVGIFKKQWGITGLIYLFSALEEEELRGRAERAGADGYIAKSWGTDRLLEVVSEVLGT